MPHDGRGAVGLLRRSAAGDNAAMQTEPSTAEPSTAEPPKRSRRWFQFSLRTLLIFAIVFAIPCAWLGRKIERKRREREVVNAIVKLGGEVSYDYQFDPSGYRIPNPHLPGPEWLRQLLGENFFTDVEVMGITITPDAEAALANVRGLTQLKILWLWGRRNTVSDAWIVNLKALTQLKELTLGNIKITDAGLESLKDLTQLQRLVLAETKVTDAGLVHLEDLTRLQYLFLTKNNVTDAGLVHLRGLSKLRYLNLENTNVTDAGVRQLQKALPNCEISFWHSDEPFRPNWSE